MAEEGSLRAWLDKHLSIKDDNVLNPVDSVTGDKPMEITPDKAMSGISQAKDPRNIMDDSGKIVDYDMGDPISRALKGIITKPAEKGTLRNFLDRMISPTRERNNPGVEGGAQPRLEELNSTPSKLRSPATLAPTPKDYSMSGLDPASMDELRKSIYEQTGQGAVPNSASAGVVSEAQDPNSLGARMNSPNAPQEMKDQSNEAEAISNRFRPIGNSPIQRPGKKPDQPFSGLRNWLSQGNLG